MRISDWSSDVCSSDLAGLLGKAVDHAEAEAGAVALALGGEEGLENLVEDVGRNPGAVVGDRQHDVVARHDVEVQGGIVGIELLVPRLDGELRSEEHTSEFQSLMRISYAVFCLKKT